MKRILITAALPYANYSMHIGHIRSTYIPADTYARFCRLQGWQTYFVCGTDDHGTPVVVMSEKYGKTPKEWVDQWYAEDKELFDKYFSTDIFHRTSSPENHKLRKGGFIYEKEISLLYCQKCKRFLPDRFVLGTCPFCGAADQYGDGCEQCGRTYSTSDLKNPRCRTCGETPAERMSKHYFFALSAFKDKLKEWLSGNKELQSESVNYIVKWLDDLRDWDIVRDLNWGIPVPGRKRQVFYVWFDAPIGYMAATASLIPKGWKRIWKKWKIVHFIGKDNSYPHYLFWPAMLMGTGFKPPDAIPTRGWLTFGGAKLSKSRGVMISFKEFVQLFPLDMFRYYSTMITPNAATDADFTWKDFQAKVNNELIGNFANFVNRTATLLAKHGKLSSVDPERFDKADKKVLREITKARRSIAKHMECFELKEGLEEAMTLSTELNKYISDREPWKETDATKNNKTYYICTRGISALAIILAPYLPETAKEVARMFSIPADSIIWKNADKQLIPEGFELKEVKPLFKKIEDSVIEELEKKAAAAAQ